MKQKIQKYIPIAIQVIKDLNIADANGRVKSAFKGYFSSFGASITQAGLLPSVIFFEGEGESEEDRYKVCQAIRLLMEKEENENHSYLPNTLERNSYRLQDILIRKSDEDLIRMLSKINVLAISLKLALRTFSLIKSN